MNRDRLISPVPEVPYVLGSAEPAPFAAYEVRRWFRLWTLGELMKTFKAGHVVDLLSRLLGGAAITLDRVEDRPGPVRPDPRGVVEALGLLRELRTECREYGWVVSLRLIDPLIRRIEGSHGLSASDLANLIGEAVRTTTAEIDTQAFVSIPGLASEFYQQPHLFGEAVTDRFSPAADDIREAGNCFALGRYTASVFHLMRVLECGLIELGAIAGLNDPKPSWESVLNAIKRALDVPYPQRSAELQRHSRFIQQTMPHFEAIKDAWRNKVGHFENKIVPTAEYTKEKAEVILINTRELMKLLTKELAK